MDYRELCQLALDIGTKSTFKLGTYAEWKAGKAPWFYEDTTFVVMLIFVMLLWMGGLAYFFVSLRRQGKALS